MSGRLITLANSALFGSGRNETRNLEDAVVRFGMNQVMDLVYALELPKTFKKCKAFDQVEFWKHSLAWLLLLGRWLEKYSLILMILKQAF
jgi:HD-like signal output (HDOD) protein